MTKKRKSLRDFFIKFVSVVDSGDNPEAEVVMFKEKGGVKMKKLEEILKGMEEEDAKVVKVEIDKIEVLEKDKEKLEKEKGELEEEVKKSKKTKEPDVPSDEDLIKSADPKVQAILEKHKEDAKVAKEEADKLKKEKDEEVKKARKVELKKEAEEYPNLGSPVEDIVEIFSVIDGDEKTTELVKGIFGAVNKALEGSGLLKSVGNDKDPKQKTSEEELMEKAEAMVEKDGITIEAAKTKIYQSDPEKYMK